MLLNILCRHVITRHKSHVSLTTRQARMEMILRGKNEEGRRVARHPLPRREGNRRGGAWRKGGLGGMGRGGRYVLVEMFVFVPFLKE